MSGLNFNCSGNCLTADFTARGNEVSSSIPREDVWNTFPLITLEGDGFAFRELRWTRCTVQLLCNLTRGLPDFSIEAKFWMHSSGVTWYFKSTLGSVTFSWRILFARIIETHCNLAYLSFKQHTLTDNFSETSLSYLLRNKHDNKREVAKLGVAMLLQGEQLRYVSRYFTWINPSNSLFLSSFLSTMLQLSRHTLEILNQWSADCCWFAPSYPTVRTVDVVLLWRWESSQLASKFCVFYWPNVCFRLSLVSADDTEWIPQPLSYPICLRSTSTFRV